jgi:hypothetical protein
MERWSRRNRGEEIPTTGAASPGNEGPGVRLGKEPMSALLTRERIGTLFVRPRHAGCQRPGSNGGLLGQDRESLACDHGQTSLVSGRAANVLGHVLEHVQDEQLVRIAVVPFHAPRLSFCGLVGPSEPVPVRGFKAASQPPRR